MCAARPISSAILAIFISSLAAGCVGAVQGEGRGSGDGKGPDEQGPTAPGAGSPGPNGCMYAPTPVATLRRLTRREYNNTVGDLLGDKSSPAAAFAPEGGSTGFDTAIDGVMINDSVVEQYANAAKKIAATAAINVAALTGCDTTAIDQVACTKQYISRFGRRAFRRSLTTDEQSRYEALYAKHRASGSFSRAIELVTRAFLLSPQFLYRTELGVGPGVRNGSTKLSPTEVATRLSYFLWGTTPSDELLALADAGGLATPEKVRAKAAQMFADDDGARVVKNFAAQWLSLERLPDLMRGQAYSPVVGASLAQETETYFDNLLRLNKASWQDFMTSESSFANGDVANIYGVPGISGTDFKQISRPTGRHRGFLTQPSLLALHAFPNDASPIHRGVFLRERILCEPHASPPPNIDPVIPAADGNKTAREQLEAKTQKAPACSGCHALINPIGFAFDNFDQTGRWRQSDLQKRPFNTAGELAGTDVDGPFGDHVELIERLARSQQASACFATQWFRYAFGRTESADDCALQELQMAFASGGHKLAALLEKIVSSDEFLNNSTEAAQ